MSNGGESDQSMSDDSQSVDNTLGPTTSTKRLKIEKKKKRGIVYLSNIPKYMNVTTVREIFSKYGEVGRVYLQLGSNADDKKKDGAKPKKKRKEASRYFTEGWVEFERKKIAKYVAATLNNTQISTRKKSKFFDIIWNIKYLPRFKWVHLSERLAYEKAVHKQRLTTEIAQAKREVNFFSYNVDRSKKLKIKEKKGETTNFVMPEVKQRETDMEIRKRKNENESEDRTQFLKSLFS
ncbi:activator of basal transcription 1 [Diachasma alloeum]|uniref:activator of basal transcription 1 n=1 Tax=Diachasma alloeum TaxID=454923 RepID=UPI00073827CD|nr:activator of basal transcription 1 [Diachasma alloeum]